MSSYDLNVDVYLYQYKKQDSTKRINYDILFK